MGIYSYILPNKARIIVTSTHATQPDQLLAALYPHIPVFQDRTWRPALPLSSSKVSWWKVCALDAGGVVPWLLSCDLTESIWPCKCLPVCLYPGLCQQLHQEKNWDSTPASCLQHTYIWLWHTERGKERGKGEREEGERMESAANELSVSEHV